MYKKFNEITINDTLYFIFDYFGMLSDGKFNNPNYGIAMTTCQVDWVHKFSETNEISVKIDRRIWNRDLWGYMPLIMTELILDKTFLVPNGEYSDMMIHNKHFDMYCFTTKKEMERFIKDRISTTQKNIKRMKKDLLEIK